MPLATLAPTLLLAPALAASAPPQDWPQWRGPERSGVSTETTLVQAWPTEGPRILWRREAGEGFSGVAVAGDELFTMWDRDASQVLVSMDATSGAPRWSHPMGPAYENAYGNGPRSTPLVDGDLVYAVGTSGRLAAIHRKSGEVLWEYVLPEDFGARLPAYGYACSPLVVGDRLFVETAGKEAAFTAFDKHTGEPLWSSQGDLPAYSSPVHVSLQGTDQVLFWSAAGLHALRPRDGALLWSHPWRTDCPTTGAPLGTGSPIRVGTDRLFLSSASRTVLLRVVAGADGFSVEPLWQAKSLRNDVNGSVLVGDHVYGFEHGTLKCIDVRTGKVAWTARGYGKGSLIAADGQLIVCGERGIVALVELSSEKFIEKSRAQVLHGKSWTSPALAAGRLYLRNHGEVVCIDMRSES